LKIIHYFVLEGSKLKFVLSTTEILIQYLNIIFKLLFHTKVNSCIIKSQAIIRKAGMNAG